MDVTARPDFAIKGIGDLACVVTAQLGFVYEVGLWGFPLNDVAHLIAGNKQFLGRQQVTWVTLWGHVVCAMALAKVIKLMPRTKHIDQPALA